MFSLGIVFDDYLFCLCSFRCPIFVPIDGCKYLSTFSMDTPGHVVKKPFSITDNHVVFTGRKHAACKYRIRSFMVVLVCRHNLFVVGYVANHMPIIHCCGDILPLRVFLSFVMVALLCVNND
jgi:hypothetical protein